MPITRATTRAIRRPPELTCRVAAKRVTVHEENADSFAARVRPVDGEHDRRAAVVIDAGAVKKAEPAVEIALVLRVRRILWMRERVAAHPLAHAHHACVAQTLGRCALHGVRILDRAR